MALSVARRLLLIALFFVSVAQSQQPAASNEKATFSNPRASSYAPHSILVRYKDGEGPSIHVARSAPYANALSRVAVERRFDRLPDLQLLKLPDDLSVPEAIRIYQSDPSVLYAEPDYLLRVSDKTPNDPMLAQQWSLQNTGANGSVAGADIRALKAWDLSTGDSSVVVGIIDSGVTVTHPDLAANLLTPTTELFDGSGTTDYVGHGTHVAGTIGAAGNNSLGVSGVNWSISMLSCKFIGSDGSGLTSAAVACINDMVRAKDDGLNLVAINNSWGGIGYSRALYDAIKALETRGVLFVVAAGNGDAYGVGEDNDEALTYPANYDLDNVISVAATDRTDSLAGFSNYGRHSVHLGAPGVAILSTVPDWLGTYTTFSGTSMATPHVTGAAGLLKAWKSSLSWWEIRNLLLTGGHQIDALKQTISGNRLDVYGAMTCSGKNLQARLMPRRKVSTITAGTPVKLKFLNIACDQPAGAVQVSVSDGNSIQLHDDGADGDEVAGDGIYAATWTAQTNGEFQLTFPNSDVVTVKVAKAYDYAVGTPGTYATITGTNLQLGDEKLAEIDPPFPVRFGGQSYQQIYVSDNGYVSLDQKFSIGAAYPIPYPSWGTVIAPNWSDLNPTRGADNNVYWQAIGTAPNRQLVVEWRQLPIYPFDTSAGAVTFQVVFNESIDDIQFNYQDVVFGGYYTSVCDRGWCSSVGIATSPDWGKQFSYGEQKLTNGLALHWTAKDPDLDLAPSPSSQTVYLDQAAQFDIGITPLYGFVGSVSVTCNINAPAQCSGTTVTPFGNLRADALIHANAGVVGTYSLDVTATGTGSASVTKTAQLQLDVVDFTLGAPSQNALTVLNGQSGTFTIPVTTSGRMAVPVTLRCNGLQSGAMCSFSPSTVTPSSTPTPVTVTVQLAPKTPIATYAFSVEAFASDAPYSRSQPMSLTVSPNPDFILKTKTPKISGSTATGSVDVDNQDGYAGTVNLSCAVVPAGPTCSVSPTSITGGIGSAQLSIALGQAAAGNYVVTVTGTDSQKSHSISIAYSAADFTISSAGGIIYGPTMNYLSYTITALNGYSGTVAVTCDATTIGPNSLCFSGDGAVNMAGRSSWTGAIYISPGNGPFSGSYPIPVIGTDTASGLRHSSSAMVTPETVAFSINDTTPITLYPGQTSDPIEFTLTPYNGFNLPVSFESYCNCTLTATTVTPNGQPVSVKLTYTAPFVRNANVPKLDISVRATVNLPSYPIWLTATGKQVLLKDFYLKVLDFSGFYTETVNVAPGHSASFKVQYVSENGFDKPISIACPDQVGLGLHCTIDKSQLIPDEIATITLSADLGTAESWRSLTLTSTATLDDARQITHQLDFMLSVTQFSIAVSPSSISLAPGANAYIQVDLTYGGLLATNLMATNTCAVTVPGLTCDVPASSQVPFGYNAHLHATAGVTPAGTYTYTVSSTIGDVTQSATGTVIVQGPNSIAVTSPNGGELWKSGSQAITWDYTGDPGSTVKIELLNKGQVASVIADSAPVGSSGSGIYNWAMPDTLAFSQHYQVRVTGNGDSSATDVSDTQVWMGKGVEFNFPNGVSVVQQGDYLVVEYSWAGNQYIDFDIYKDGKFLKQLQHGYASGYFDRPCFCWDAVGNSADLPLGGGYTVVATPVGEPNKTATSQPFAVGNRSFTITSPTKGQVWHVGDTVSVNWNITSVGLPVGNEMALWLDGPPGGDYFTNPFSGEMLLTPSVPIGVGNGTYTTTLPKGLPASTGYYIRAAIYGTGGMAARTDNFAIGDFHALKINVTGNGLVRSKDYLIFCTDVCTNLYATGTVVTLMTDSPNFTGWSGGSCSGTGQCVFTVTSDTVINASFASQDVAFTQTGDTPAPIVAGTSGKFQVSVASTPGFASPAVLSCSGMPTGMSCSFDKNNIALSTTPTVVTVTVHTTNASGQVGSVHQKPFGWLMPGMFAAILLGAGFSKKRKLAARVLLPLLVVCLTSCGGGGGGGSSFGGGGGGGGGSSSVATPPGTYQIGVNVIAGSITKQVLVQVVVR